MESHCQPILTNVAYIHSLSLPLILPLPLSSSPLPSPPLPFHIYKLHSNPCFRASAGDTLSQAGILRDCDNCEGGEGLGAAVPHSNEVMTGETSKEEQADHWGSTLKHGNLQAGSGTQPDNAQLFHHLNILIGQGLCAD